MPKAHEQHYKKNEGIKLSLQEDQFNDSPYPHYSQASTCPRLILLRLAYGNSPVPKLYTETAPQESALV